MAVTTEMVPGNDAAPALPPDGPDPGLDFARPFLPESLAQTGPLDFLSPTERLALNQIRGHAYLGVIEVMERLLVRGPCPVPAGLDGGLLRLRRAFRRGFGSPCGLLRAAEAPLVSPGGPALGSLHLAWAALHHDREARLESPSLDPAFQALLYRRGAAAEGRIDLGLRLLDLLATEGTPLVAADAVDAYLGNLERLAARLDEQAGHDLDSLVRATGRTLEAGEREEFLRVQTRANRRTFLGCAMRHPAFLRAAGRLGTGARDRIEEGARSLSPRVS